jgi:hypothetical protein
VAAVNETDETVARVRTRGPVPLPLDGWDLASIWGWDETTGSLYAHLWRNTDDPAKPPTIRIQADDYTSTLEFPATLAQHIAMAVDRDPWDVLTALYEVDNQGDEATGSKAGEAGTVVSMTESHEIWWPSNTRGNFGSQSERPD